MTKRKKQDISQQFTEKFEVNKPIAIYGILSSSEVQSLVPNRNNNLSNQIYCQTVKYSIDFVAIWVRMTLSAE